MKFRAIQATGRRTVHIWVWLHLMLTFACSGEPRLLMLHFVMDAGWPAQPAPVRSTQVVISWPEAEQKTEWGVYLLIGVDGAISKSVSEFSLPVWTHRHGWLQCDRAGCTY